jgi:hypothetical protein
MCAVAAVRASVPLNSFSRRAALVLVSSLVLKHTLNVQGGLFQSSGLITHQDGNGDCSRMAHGLEMPKVVTLFSLARCPIPMEAVLLGDDQGS